MNSLWIDSNNKHDKFESLSKDLNTDVCIIGAGIFGLTCAYYLSKLGYHTVVLEKDKIGQKLQAIPLEKSQANMVCFMII